MLPEFVAPHGGAWIEMSGVCSPLGDVTSPLTEGRGLKCVVGYDSKTRLSRPSRRGVD